MELPKPEWLRKMIRPSEHAAMAGLLGELRLHTVCREACCPNISECFSQGQATFLILGRICTRLCSFCNVEKAEPQPVDPDEPARLAEAVARLHLSHVVVTSPTRDDLADGGAAVFADTVRSVRAAAPGTVIELLVPDFCGRRGDLETVISAAPDILGHNLETVPRLYQIRPGADYRRSLRVLELCREVAPRIRVKSGVMAGLGETEEELLDLFADLRSTGCSYLSIGQYLAPSKKHHPVQAFIPPEQFARYRELALALGFRHVESGPYVRSSYHAAEYR